MSEDRTIDGAAVEEAARSATDAGASSAAAAPSEGQPAAGGDEGEGAYHKALDSYMNGDLQGVVKLVDGVLEKAPNAGLKSRLERLRRRATDRMSREGMKIEEPAAAAAEKPATTEPPAGSETPPAAAAATETPTETAAAETKPEAPSTESGEGPTTAVATAETPAEPASTEPSAAVAEATSTDPKSSGAAVKRPKGASVTPAPAATPAPPAVKRPSSGVMQALVATPGATPPVKPAGPPGTRPPQGKAPPPLATAAQLKAEMDRVTGELDKLRRTVSGIEDHILKVAEAYTKLSKDGKRKDQAYDQLYEELRQYKTNFLATAQKPLLLDIIMLFDGVSRTMASFSELSDEKVTRKMVMDALSHTRDEVLEVLYRRDIEKIVDTPKKLNVEFQKPVSRVDTDKVDEDKDIVQVVRDGFRQKDIVLRPQEVVIKRSSKEREPQ